MVSTTLLLAAVLLPTAPQTAAPNKPSDGKLSGFVVALIDDVNVPAREAGTLAELSARLGDLVRKGAELGRIDDSDAQVRRLIADNQLNVAKAQAESDANVKAARATVGVAQEEYKETMDIKQRVPDAVSDFELRRKRLTHERSMYEAVNAEVDQKVNVLTRDVRAAQLQAVENEIKRRIVESPIDGVIVKRMRDPGEWVQPGDPIFRVVRMDRLRVEGLLDADKYDRSQLLGHPVNIEVSTPHGVETVSSKITFVSTVVDAGGDLLVYAEFDNQRAADGHWPILPGRKASIQILVRPQVARTSPNQP